MNKAWKESYILSSHIHKKSSSVYSYNNQVCFAPHEHSFHADPSKILTEIDFPLSSEVYFLLQSSLFVG